VLDRGGPDGVSLAALSRDLPLNWQNQADHLGLWPPRCDRGPWGHGFAAHRRSSNRYARNRRASGCPDPV